MNAYKKWGIVAIFFGLGAAIFLSLSFHVNASEDGWENPVNITQNDGSSYRPRLMVDSHNNLHMVWKDWVDLVAHPPYVLYAIKPYGEPWKPFEYLPGTPQGDFPEAVIDTDDVVHVIWDSPDGAIHYNHRKNNGAWSSEEAIATIGQNPSIAVGSDGTVHATWWARADGTFPKSQIYYSAKPKGGTWSKPVVIINNEHIGQTSMIVVDKDNTAHVLIDTDRTSSPIRLFYTHKAIGENWIVPQQLTFNVNIWSTEQFTVGSDGTLHLVWIETSQSPVRTDVKYAHKNPNEQWSQSKSWRTDFCNYSSITTDSLGKPHVVWVVGDDLHYIFQNEKGDWVNGTPTDMTSGWISNTSGELSMVVDDFYRKHLTWDTGPVGDKDGKPMDERGDIFYTSLPGYPGVSTVITSSGGILLSADGNTRMDFPAGAVVTDTRITHTPAGSPPTGTYYPLKIFDLSAEQVSNGNPVTLFASPYTLTITYTKKEMGSAIQNTIGLYTWDGSQWATESFTHDEANQRIIAKLNHMTYFALLGETHWLYIPLVLRGE